MKASEKLLQIFPVKNPMWQTFLQCYLDKHEETCSKILENTEPHLDTILPSPSDVFHSLSYANPDQYKVVIIGQDPYPNKEDPHGLCFSVEHGRPPASLKNIFKEIQADFGGEIRKNGNLTDWAKQGVLLLNSSLTVLPNQANSHSRIGWQIITEFVVKTVWAQSPSSVFLLWGNNAKQLLSPVPVSPRVLIAGHPSPLAYGKGNTGNFKGCGHFKKANQILVSFGQMPIVWHQSEPLLDFIRQ